MLISDSTLSQNKENHFREGEIYPLKRTSFSISFAAWNISYVNIYTLYAWLEMY